jgi:protein gp37
MAERTAIQWCDSTFNPWIGCTKVGPGCDHCYAEISTPSRTRRIAWGPGAQRQRTGDDYWKHPEKWNAERFYKCACGWRGPDSALLNRNVAAHSPGCPSCGNTQRLEGARRRVFCASLADVFDNEVPAEWRTDLFRLIRRTPNLDWLLLTKRIGNVVPMINRALNDGHLLTSREPLWPWSNVWLGITVVNQAEVDRDVPKLLQTNVAVRFLSIEPMLGAIEFSNVTKRDDAVQQLGKKALDGIHWIIAGGESGPKARPVHPDWIRSLRDQCAGAGVPFLFKQWGEFREFDDGDGELKTVDADELSDYAKACIAAAQNPHYILRDGRVFRDVDEIPYELAARMVERVGKKIAGNTLDGRQHLEWPA